MARYLIEFEKGGTFELEFDPAAAKTVSAFKDFMSKRTEPYQALCLQGRFSGEEMYFPAPLEGVEEENPIAPFQGCVAFNPNPQWSAICVYWGSELAEKDHYHNLFAHVKGNEDQLKEVGTRIWQKGGETITLKRIDSLQGE